MRLSHPSLHFSFEFDESQPAVWIIERSDLYREYVNEIGKQCDGLEGSFILSEGWKLINIPKSTLVITDLLHLELNGKKQGGMLLKRFVDIANDGKFVQTTLLLKDAIDSWALQLENEIPIAIIHERAIDTVDLLKALGIRFDHDNCELPELLCYFIRICAEFLKINVLIIVGMHAVMTGTEIEAVYQTALYEKVSIIDIERAVPDQHSNREKWYVLDKDLCEIYKE